MIVVKVELWSAITGEKSELARMHISNSGESQNPRLGDYLVQTFKGRSKRDLDLLNVSHIGEIKGWRRLDWHVWNLVRRALEASGYDKGPTPTPTDV